MRSILRSMTTLLAACAFVAGFVGAAGDERQATAAYAGGKAPFPCSLSFMGVEDVQRTCFPLVPGETHVRLAVRDELVEEVRVSYLFSDERGRTVEYGEFCNDQTPTLAIPGGAVVVGVFPLPASLSCKDAFLPLLDEPLAAFATAGTITVAFWSEPAGAK